MASKVHKLTKAEKRVVRTYLKDSGLATKSYPEMNLNKTDFITIDLCRPKRQVEADVVIALQAQNTREKLKWTAQAQYNWITAEEYIFKRLEQGIKLIKAVSEFDSDYEIATELLLLQQQKAVENHKNANSQQDNEENPESSNSSDLLGE